MKITTVLFDLDGTLLPMDQDEFTKGYFGLLTKKMSAFGYDPGQLADAVWKGTAAMAGNDGAKSNKDVFWRKFAEILGARALLDNPLFEEFYANEFNEAKAFCGFDPRAAQTVKTLKERGLRVVLATNPIFPKVATESRIRWAGLQPEDFELYTTYENSCHCKPNPAYYTDILKVLDVQPSECTMVGNDVAEDMIARTLGMKVFLLTDCLINQKREDINQYPRGSFEQLMLHIEMDSEKDGIPPADRDKKLPLPRDQNRFHMLHRGE